MAKPPPRRIPSDDYVTTVDGIDYHSHEGEWIEVVGSVTVAEMQAAIELQAIGVEMAATDDQMERVSLIGRHFEMVCAGLARRIVAWSWTDAMGQPLPSPFGSPETLGLLAPDELAYLIDATQAEHRAERKNASPPSPITFSGTGSPATAAQPSTMAHSRTRAS